MSEWGIGVDIGGTHICSAAVNLQTGEVLKESEFNLDVNHEWPKSDILEKWRACINQSISTLKYEQKIKGIGFAFPGPFNYKDGISMMDHKFVSLYKCDISSLLKPLILLEESSVLRFINDASAFGIGECWKGMGSTSSKVILCTLGTGFGSVFMDDLQPIIDRDDVPSEGCLWHLKFHQGIADEYFSTRWFVREYKKRTGRKISGAREIFHHTNDVVAQEIMNEFTDNLATFLGPWIQKFKADQLVFGGSIARSLQLFKPRLLEKFSGQGISIKVQESSLKEKAAIIGAAKILEEDCWNKVKNSLGK